MSADFLQQFFPDRVRILGLRLRPFSIGHKLILQRLGSPFLDARGEPRLADLLKAALICSLPVEEAVEVINSGESAKAIGKWMRRVAWLNFLHRRKSNIAHAIAHFAQYIADGSAGPEWEWITEGGTETFECKSPPLQLVKIVLQSRLGYSETEALNCPLGRALWNYATFFEHRHQLAILDEETKNERHEWQRLADEHAAKMFAAAEGGS